MIELEHVWWDGFAFVGIKYLLKYNYSSKGWPQLISITCKNSIVIGPKYYILYLADLPSIQHGPLNMVQLYEKLLEVVDSFFRNLTWF